MNEDGTIKDKKPLKERISVRDGGMRGFLSVLGVIVLAIIIAAIAYNWKRPVDTASVEPRTTESAELASVKQELANLKETLQTQVANNGQAQVKMNPDLRAKIMEKSKDLASHYFSIVLGNSMGGLKRGEALLAAWGLDPDYFDDEVKETLGVYIRNNHTTAMEMPVIKEDVEKNKAGVKGIYQAVIDDHPTWSPDQKKVLVDLGYDKMTNLFFKESVKAQKDQTNSDIQRVTRKASENGRKLAYGYFDKNGVHIVRRADFAMKVGSKDFFNGGGTVTFR